MEQLTSISKPKSIKTSDYNKFEFSDSNRDINNPHVKELRGSIQRNGFLPSKAIEVYVKGRKFVILDGQHRFTAAQLENVPFYYIIVEKKDDEILPDLQISLKWKPKDYLKHFLNKGAKGYDSLNELTQEYPQVSIMVLVQLLSDSSLRNATLQKDFHNGILTVKDINRVRECLDYLIDLNNKYKKSFYFTRTFLDFFYLKVIKSNKYNHDRFLSKLLYLNENFIQCQSQDTYLKKFNEIYNYKCTQNNRIEF